MRFEESLKVGKVAESLIARWLQKRGNYVLPIYEIEKNQFAGPAIYIEERPVIAPDIMAINSSGNCCWIESKNKSAFTWHRLSKRWTTGIDLKHYNDYLYLMRKIDIPIYLFFNQNGGKAKDSKKSESGLFVADLNFLKDHENHRCEAKPHCKNGMVFWAKDKFSKVGDCL